MRLGTQDGLVGFERLLARIEQAGAGGKQHVFEAPGGRDGRAALLLSLENLPEWPRLRDDLRSGAAGAVEIEEGVGAVSAIGAGINATPRNLRRAVGVLRPLETPLLGVSTSSFSISILLAEACLDEAVRALHRNLIETEPAPAEA